MIPRLEPRGYQKPKRKHKSYSERLVSEPWRRDGYSAKYRARRDSCIQRTGGRCSSCGKRVAVKTEAGWKMRGGETHHINPLSRGGGDELVLLCTSCHRKVDASIRRRIKG